ncbi:flagellar basal body-associated FliL family protein [Sporolactobacillus vineae]|uniref:flagellar basal body-associated FliL family protein n=1 Tax=Sporolactobacillus vineae TaxID=444463 RepID=UPI0002885B7E|nr:flagellar basal body-associated FliL family protein [Sporolactobacillus vineae]
MFKSKGLNIIFILMIVMIIGTVIAYFLLSGYAQSRADVRNPSIDEINKDLTVSTGEITTNIQGDHFIKVDFNIQVSNKQARDELQKRSFQMKNAVIYVVSDLTAGKIQNQQGIAGLENQIKNRINGFLQSGTVTHVYTTEKIVQ